MNAPVSHHIELGNYVRSHCGQSFSRYDAIANAAHDLAGIAACNGTVWGLMSREKFEALARFVDFVRSEESIPLRRERVETDEQSSLPEYPHVLEPLQE